jgi:uncharacterized protein with HEPN domain
MPVRSLIPRLKDIIEAIGRVRGVVGDMNFDAFEADWEKQWLVERGIEIVSEASRHLTDELKARHPNIPWRNVADIGNVLRHGYHTVAAPIMWSLVKEHLAPLEQVCRDELATSDPSEI